MYSTAESRSILALLHRKAGRLAPKILQLRYCGGSVVTSGMLPHSRVSDTSDMPQNDVGHNLGVFTTGICGLRVFARPLLRS